MSTAPPPPVSASANSLHADLDYILDHTRGLWEEMRGERIFLTGGTGYVGSWLMESLVWANRRLGLDVSATMISRDPAAYRRRSPHLAEAPEITVRPGNQVDFPFPEGSYPLVIHAATEPSFPGNPQQPTGYFDANVAGTRRALEFAAGHGAKRVLFTSSGAVYGTHPPDLPNMPEDFPGAPLPCDIGTLSAYGTSKRFSEFLCASYAQVFGFAAPIARIYAQSGAYLQIDTGYALGNFIADVLAGRPIRIAGDGTPFRSYQYAADMTIWLWTILLRGKSAFPYNVGSPEPVSILELARHVAAAIAPGTPIEIAKTPRPGEPPARYVPSVERAAALGLENRVGLDEGIRRMFEWYRNRRPS